MPSGALLGVARGRWRQAAAIASTTAWAKHSGRNAKLVPTSGMPVMAEASIVIARRSSGSRSCTSYLPQARANICISCVIELRKPSTRSAASSTVSRAISSSSCVAMPDRAEAGVAVVAGARLGAHARGSPRRRRGRLQLSAIMAAVPIETASAPSASALAASTPLRIPPETIRLTTPSRRISRIAATASTGGGQRRDAGVVHERVGRGAGAALHAVDHDHVGAGLAGQLDVVGHAAGADLDVDRDLAVGRLAQLLELDLQVVGPDEVGVAAGRALVDAGRQRARLGDDRRDLRAQQHAAGAGLGALADHDLGGVRHAQVVRVEAVAAGQHLVDELVGGLALEVEHAAVAGGGRDADAGGRRAQRLLGVARERAVAHAGDRDRRGQPDRLGAVAGADLDVRCCSARGSPPAARARACTGTNVRSSKWGGRLVMPRPRLV